MGVAGKLEIDGGEMNHELEAKVAVQDRPARALESVKDDIMQLHGRLDTLCGQSQSLFCNLMGEDETAAKEKERPELAEDIAFLGDGDIAKIQREFAKLLNRCGHLEGIVADLQRVIG
jgi:hypothetical protein